MVIHTKMGKDVNMSMIPFTMPLLSASDKIHQSVRIFLATTSVLLLLIGVPGNILTIVVLSKRRLRDNFLSIYLTALACFNIMALVIALPRLMYLGITQYDLRYINANVCFYHWWLQMFSLCGANWTLVLVTGIRMIHLGWPEKTNSIFTRNFAVVTLALLYTILACILYIGFRVRISTKLKNEDDIDGEVTSCVVNEGTIMTYIQVLLFAFIPGVCLLVFNSCIIGLYWMRSGHVSLATQVSSRAGYHLALMVFLSDFQFMLTIMPSAMHFTLKDTIHTTLHIMPSHYTTAAILAIILYSNYATNFLVYCLFGSRFRHEFQRIVCICTGKQLTVPTPTDNMTTRSDYYRHTKIQDEYLLSNSSNSSGTEAFLDPVIPYHGTGRVVMIIFSIFLLLTGIPGNVFTIVVLRTKCMRESFLSLFLVFLSGLNILSLTTGLGRHLILAMFYWNLRLISREVCAGHRWAVFTFLTGANWVLVFVTVGRLIFLQFPIKASYFCTSVRVVGVVQFLMVAIGLYQYFALRHLLQIKEDEETGSLVECALKSGTAFNFWNMALMCFIPAVLLMLINATYLRYIWYNIPTGILRRNAQRLIGYHIGLLVLLSDVHFLVTNVPFGILHSTNAWTHLGQASAPNKNPTVYIATHLLLYANCASNFFIYCLFGVKFRLEVKKLISHYMPKCCASNFPSLAKNFEVPDCPTVENTSNKPPDSFTQEVTISGKANDNNQDFSMANLFRDPDASPTAGTPEFSARASVTTDSFLIGPRAGQIRNFSPDNLEYMLQRIDPTIVKPGRHIESYV